MAATTVKVGDMSCGHCVAAIEGAVKKVAGVTGMEANLETKVVTVTFEGDPDQGAVVSAVQDAGYTPEILD
jgi:copper chaperone